MRTLILVGLLLLSVLASYGESSSAVVDTEAVDAVDSIGSTITPIALHGQLSVSGTQLVDACGRPVQLRGVSHFWHPWEGKQHWNADVAKWLRDDWRVSLLRAPLATHPNVQGDYLTEPDSSMAQLRQLVDGAVAAGVYIIIDFHAHYAYPQEAREVLGTIAKEYGHTPNVLYAIWNEPVGTQEYGTTDGPEATWESIRAYAKEVIPAIRAHDSNNIIVVPTAFYDQFPDVAATAPLTDDYLGASASNIMYDVHAYAGQHKKMIRDRAQVALDAGLPIIMTEVGRVGVEWGPDNKLDTTSFNEWMTWIEANNITYTKWSLSTKNERSSSLQPTAAATGEWSADDLTDEGKWNRAHFRKTGAAFNAQPACD